MFAGRLFINNKDAQFGAISNLIIFARRQGISRNELWTSK